MGLYNYLKGITLRIRENIIPEDLLIKIRGAIFDSIRIYDLTRSTVLQLINAKGILAYIVNFFQSQQAINQRNTQQAAKLAKDYINPKLKEKLRTLDFINKISKPLGPTFEDMQTDIISKITNSLVNLLVRFEEEHVDPAKRNFSESETKRKEIAEKNYKIRVEQIEPLRREIREFEAQVSNEINA